MQLNVYQKKNFIKLVLFFLILLPPSSHIYAQKKQWFKEDFNNNQNKWIVGNYQYLELKIEDGRYIMKILMRQDYRIATFWGETIYINPNIDFTFETAITLIKGYDINGTGFIWGAKDYENYYVFRISQKQFFQIVKVKNNKETKICPWTPCKKVNPPNQYNQLKVARKNDSLHFYINQEKVYSCDFLPFFGRDAGYETNNQVILAADYLYFYQDNEIKTVPNMPNDLKKENMGKNINTPYIEVLPVISADDSTLYYVIGKSPENTAKNDQDIWFAKRKDTNTWNEKQNIGKPLNNQRGNAVIAVSQDNNMLILNGIYNQDGSFKDIGLSSSKRTKDGWEIPKKMDINNYYNKHNYTSACLSANQKVLILSVQRNDTYGKLDLYVSFRQKDDTWSTPVNMGKTINTFGDDATPFLAADNVTLYYSTNGQPGFGSNDIFITRRLDDTWKKWSEPLNLDSFINTPYWDAYYTIPASGEYAYIVSEENAIGQTDIFRIKLPQEIKPEPVVLIFGKVFNSKTNEPIEAKITYTELGSDKEAGIANSDPANGKYSIILQKGKKYAFLATKENFLSVNEHIDLQNVTDYQEIERNLYLAPVEVGTTIRLNNVFFDTGKAELKTESEAELNKLVLFLTNNPTIKIQISGHTDNVGSAQSNKILSQNRANAVKNYLTDKGINTDRITAKGYGATKPQTTNSTEKGRAFNRRVEATILEKTN